MRSTRHFMARIVLLFFVLSGIIVVYPDIPQAAASTAAPSSIHATKVSNYPVRHSNSMANPPAGLPVAHAARVNSKVANSPACPCGVGNLTYHNGSVQTQPEVYLIFWGSSWKNKSGSLTKTGQIVENYFQDVGSTNYEDILTQYYMQNQNGTQTYIPNSLQFDSKHVWIDTSTVTPTDNNCTISTVEDSTLHSEISKAIQKKGWPNNDVNATYFVYTPSGYAIRGPGNGCSNSRKPNQGFCGYHFWTLTFVYAALPYSIPGCLLSKYPNGDQVGDSLTNTSAHEQFEAITDPEIGDKSGKKPFDGWYDQTPQTQGGANEIGDKCNFVFPSNYTHLNNGGIFEIQLMYSDTTSSCVNTFRPRLTVNTTADLQPPCTIASYSLRCAIMQSNSDNSGKPVWFNIPSSDSGCTLNTIQGKDVFVCTITPTIDLPALTASNTSINGYTQLGASQNTLPMGSGDNAILTVRIDGTNGVGGLVLSGNATLDHLLGLEITNFSSYGILLSSNTVTNDAISGNFIGTDGTNALGNGAGIYVASSSSYNTIGLGTPVGVNLISGNSGQGVVIDAGTGNVIQGNYIGTDTTGKAALHRTKGRHILPPLRNSGIANGTGISLFAGASNNQIGGILAASANVISYNTDGITSEGGSNTSIIGNTLSSNFIGVKADSGETGDTIDQNIITANTDAGVLVGNSSTDSTHVAIQDNSIFGNGGLGIDLAPVDTVNCSGPTPGAPNDYTPCPVIQIATQTQVSGTACVGCFVEVYIASNESDDQGHGEGQSFLGLVTADSSGNWSLNVSLSPGTQITATATTPSSPGHSETSEFAANVVTPGSGGNLWITGHDADYHCAVDNLQCNYLKVAVNFVTNGSTLPVLALDHGTLVAQAISIAFGSSGPTVVTVDPRTQFAGLPLVDSNGKPLYSAIVIASDITCGGCDNNNGFGDTPDSDAINARTFDIQTYFNAGGGILALAGAQNISVFYNFLPIPATGADTTSPYTLTALGLSLGLIEGQDDNCCETHNSFQLPGSGSQFQVAETDAAGLAETMIVQNGTAVNWKRPPRSTQKPVVPRNHPG